MACRKIGRILTLALLLLAAPARAEELAAMVAALDGRICSLDQLPESDRRLLATTREHRVQLYLRCQLKGRDEFVRTECCEHLNADDKRAVGLCPSNPTTEGVVQELKKGVRC
jgi:hypothetical protein